MSADALVVEDLKILETLPNYRRYVMGGARTKSMLSVYPSVTYAAHTSMITGGEECGTDYRKHFLARYGQPSRRRLFDQRMARMRA